MTIAVAPRFGILAAILCAALCSSAIAQSPQSPPVNPPSKRIAPADWEAAHGIYRYVLYSGDIVWFTYGSAQRRKMSVDDFVVFVRDKLSDQTVVTARPPFLPLTHDETPDDFYAVDMAYYAPDGSLAFVTNLVRKPYIGKWSVVRATRDQLRVGADPVLLCWDAPTFEAHPSTVSPVHIRDGCVSAYASISSILGKRKGDVFGLQKEEFRLPPAHYYLDGFKPDPWPDGQPLISKKAPHD